MWVICEPGMQIYGPRMALCPMASSQALCQTAAVGFGCSLGWESSAAGCPQGGHAGISPVFDMDSEPIFLGPAVQHVQRSLPQHKTLH